MAQQIFNEVVLAGFVPVSYTGVGAEGVRLGQLAGGLLIGLIDACHGAFTSDFGVPRRCRVSLSLFLILE